MEVKYRTETMDTISYLLKQLQHNPSNTSDSFSRDLPSCWLPALAGDLDSSLGMGQSKKQLLPNRHLLISSYHLHIYCLINLLGSWRSYITGCQINLTRFHMWGWSGTGQAPYMQCMLHWPSVLGAACMWIWPDPAWAACSIKLAGSTVDQIIALCRLDAACRPQLYNILACLENLEFFQVICSFCWKCLLLWE